MLGYFCIRFIDFMIKDKSLLDYTNLFSPNECEKNDKIILKYYLNNYDRMGNKCRYFDSLILLPP